MGFKFLFSSQQLFFILSAVPEQDCSVFFFKHTAAKADISQFYISVHVLIAHLFLRIHTVFGEVGSGLGTDHWSWS